MKKNKKGFTLLELLVVIGIIGILVSISVASYSTAQKKARDAKRKGDLQAIKNCLEQNYSNNLTNSYQYEPLSKSGTDNSLTSASIGCGGTQNMDLTNVKDPLNTTINSVLYKYVVVTSTATDYDLKANLEGGGFFEVTNSQ